MAITLGPAGGNSVYPPENTSGNGGGDVPMLKPAGGTVPKSFSNSWMKLLQGKMCLTFRCGETLLERVSPQIFRSLKGSAIFCIAK